jgi:hypothetical protein
MGTLCSLSRHFSSSSSGSNKLALYNLTSMVYMNARFHQVLQIVLDRQSHLTPLSTHAHHAFIKALVDAAQQSVPVSSEEQHYPKETGSNHGC